MGRKDGRPKKHVDKKKGTAAVTHPKINATPSSSTRTENSPFRGSNHHNTIVPLNSTGIVMAPFNGPSSRATAVKKSIQAVEATNRPHLTPPSDHLQSTPCGKQSEITRKSTEKTKQVIEIAKVETSSVRAPGTNADITICATRVLRNEVNITKTTYTTGYVKRIKLCSYAPEVYNFVEEFAAMTVEEKKSYLENRWVEVVVEIPEIVAGVKGSDSGNSISTNALDQLAALGPEFDESVKNLVVRVKLPHLSNLALTTPLLLTTSLGYTLIKKVVAKVRKFHTLKKMDVLLQLCHTFNRGLDELQLGFILPFYELAFTRWSLKYSVPGMYQPDRVSKEDLGQLQRLNKKFQDMVFQHPSEFEPEPPSTWAKPKVKREVKREYKGKGN
ncbi:uncharacterized protein PAC_07227 [Phialocephala subalpina]|uniref:Uncharacterized protein n=1 Tax=Phialocephala subalpina TaxID=576137 RepID=A0A1L7WX52_9HELO|nr:uncharacterized protein PAC_07227 [Phialocephala subalpina]